MLVKMEPKFGENNQDEKPKFEDGFWNSIYGTELIRIRTEELNTDSMNEKNVAEPLKSIFRLVTCKNSSN